MVLTFFQFANLKNKNPAIFFQETGFYIQSLHGFFLYWLWMIRYL